MKFLVGVPKIELYNVNDNTLEYQFRDAMGYSQDWENDIIYVDVAFVPENKIKLDRYVMKITFEQFTNTEPPNLALVQIDDYIKQYRVEYVGYWIPQAKNSEPVVFRHKFYIEWQERC